MLNGYPSTIAQDDGVQERNVNNAAANNLPNLQAPVYDIFSPTIQPLPLVSENSANW